jgi:hypothetical protein
MRLRAPSSAFGVFCFEYAFVMPSAKLATGGWCVGFLGCLPTALCASAVACLCHLGLTQSVIVTHDCHTTRPLLPAALYRFVAAHVLQHCVLSPWLCTVSNQVDLAVHTTCSVGWQLSALLKVVAAAVPCFHGRLLMNVGDGVPY